MAKTVACLFNSEAEASAVIRRLEDAGIARGDICIFTNTGTNRYWDTTTGAYEGTRTGAAYEGTSAPAGGKSDRIVDYLTDNGVPRSDAHAYAEGVRRGNALVAVRCDDDQVDRVVSILDTDAVLDIDEQQAAWRSEGWRGYEPARTGSEVRGGEEVIPVAEEELHVGKRDVGRGRIRINSHVVERPVEEQVTLREERVDVERRPVDKTVRQPGMGGDDMFRERSVEMDEHVEKPVVSKDARVTEEVVARKHGDQRTETVSDTVRKTEVEVEDERANRTSRTGTTDHRK